MGTFCTTCAVSGLPIEEGDEVRFFLLVENPIRTGMLSSMHDVWFPRTFPLRAKYDGSGSVKDVESGPAQDVWLETFRLDAVTCGRGDAAHDVAITKAMDFQTLLDAVAGRRLRVRQSERDRVSMALRRELRRLRCLPAAPKRRWDVLAVWDAAGTESLGIIEARTERRAMKIARKRYSEDKHHLVVRLAKDQPPEEPLPPGVAVGDILLPRRPIPPGIPTRQRVEAALRRAFRGMKGFGVYGDPDSKDAGFIVDKRAYGEVRVRWEGLDSRETSAHLDRAQRALQEYASMVCADDGHNSRAKLLVRPKANTKDFYGSRGRSRRARSLLVEPAMVREDVWQAFLKLKIFDVCSGEEKSLRLEHYEKHAREVAAQHEERFARQQSDVGRLLTEFALVDLGSTLKDIAPNFVPFVLSLGMQWSMLASKGPMPKAFVQTAAEFAFVRDLLSRTRYWWRPSYGIGPQFSEWEEHETLYEAIGSIARAKADEERRQKADA